MTSSPTAGLPTTIAATRPGSAPLRVALALLVAMAVAVGLTFVAAPAQAAFTTVQKAHGGKLQACKVPAMRNGERGFLVRARLDNRSAQHTHLGGMSRFRGGQSRESVDFRVPAGKRSPAKVLFFNPGRDLLSMGMGETDGTGAGGDISLGSLGRC